MLPFHIARYIMMSGTYVSGQFPDSFRIVGVHLEANGPWGRLWDHDSRAAQITKNINISLYVQQKDVLEWWKCEYFGIRIVKVASGDQKC